MLPLARNTNTAQLACILNRSPIVDCRNVYTTLTCIDTYIFVNWKPSLALIYNLQCMEMRWIIPWNGFFFVSIAHWLCMHASQTSQRRKENTEKNVSLESLYLKIIDRIKKIHWIQITNYHFSLELQVDGESAFCLTLTRPFIHSLVCAHSIFFFFIMLFISIWFFLFVVVVVFFTHKIANTEFNSSSFEFIHLTHNFRFFSSYSSTCLYLWFVFFCSLTLFLSGQKMILSLVQTLSNKSLLK